MTTLTMAQALRHMAERAEAGSKAPWDDLEIYNESLNKWVNYSGHGSILRLRNNTLRLKPQPKLVNGVECHPRRGELVEGQKYYVPTPNDEYGFSVINYNSYNDVLVERLHKRASIYTTKEAALVEAKAQGWV